MRFPSQEPRNDWDIFSSWLLPLGCHVCWGCFSPTERDPVATPWPSFVQTVHGFPAAPPPRHTHTHTHAHKFTIQHVGYKSTHWQRQHTAQVGEKYVWASDSDMIWHGPLPYNKVQSILELWPILFLNYFIWHKLITPPLNPLLTLYMATLHLKWPHSALFNIWICSKKSKLRQILTQ